MDYFRDNPHHPTRAPSISQSPPTFLAYRKRNPSFFFFLLRPSYPPVDRFKRSFLDMFSRHSFPPHPTPYFSASLSFHRLFSLRPEYTPVCCLLNTNTNIPSRLPPPHTPFFALYFLSLPNFLKEGSVLSASHPSPQAHPKSLHTLRCADSALTKRFLGQWPLLNPVSLSLPGEGDIG